MPTAERAETLMTGPLRLLLVWPWLLYRPLVRLRNLLFDWGLRRARRLPVAVCSVGNIGLGGTGKTPVVALLGERLAARGLRPMVLSRGYKGDAGGNDEAAMLDLPVRCDPVRVRAGRQAIADGATALVLDDGFQHRQLARDLDLVCIDATRPWGRADGRRGRTLPLGLLREAPAALGRADLLMVTRCDQVDAQRLERLVAQLERFGKPVLRCRHAPVALRELGADATRQPAELAGTRVVLASGIGNPGAFAATVRQLGAEPAAEHRFPDHHRFTAAEVAALLETAGEAPLLITAKDAVKWLPLVPAAARARVLVLEVAARLAADDDARLDAALASGLERSARSGKLGR